MDVLEWLRRLATSNIERDTDDSRTQEERELESGNAGRMVERVQGKREVTERPTPDGGQHRNDSR